MGLFRRAKRPTDAIRAFWAWWAAAGRDAATRALDERAPHRVVDAFAARVVAVSGQLSWELSKGMRSRYALVVTAGGASALRPLARRWRMAAPPADDIWEYTDFRPPAPGSVLEMAGHRIDSADVSVAAEVRTATLHVRLHHPLFAHMTGETRTRAMFVLLDTTLGEAEVETWIGAVEAADTRPPDAVPLADLPAVVAGLAARCVDEDGEPQWVILRGETTDGTPVLASTQVPLRSATAPHLDTHVAVVVPFEDRTESGFPGLGSADPLNALEDHLRGRLGGSGRVVARETLRGTRTLHVYVDGTTPAVEQLRVAVRGWDQGRVELAPQPDPGWEAVAHLRA